MQVESMENVRVLQVLKRDRDDVMSQWVSAVAAALGRKTSAREVEQELAPLYDAIVALGDEDPSVRGDALDQAHAVLSELSRSRARQGFTPTETALSVFALKEVVHAHLGGSDAENAHDFVMFSRLIDDLGLYTFGAYVSERESVISSQAEQLLELSTPVVKLWEGVVAVPLVGTLDSARTQVVMENLLETLVATGSTQAIIDITGVPAVDTQVAQHLLKTVVAAKLMGADCIVSGVRPQIAQTIVALGIEFGDIVTKATLGDALALALARVGATVVYDSANGRQHG